MANRWISQNNFITSTNIYQPQSDFTIPKIERVVNKKTGQIPLKILDFNPAPYVVLRFIGHPYRRVLRQAVFTPRAGPERAKPRTAFRLLGVAMLNYFRG
jgi:hypothetical protein